MATEAAGSSCPVLAGRPTSGQSSQYTGEYGGRGVRAVRRASSLAAMGAPKRNKLPSTIAGVLCLLAGLFTLIGVTMATGQASADTSTPYACLNPRAPDSTGGPWLLSSGGLGSWQNPTDPSVTPSDAEIQVASDLGQALGSKFSQLSVQDYANAQCDTFWDITYQNSETSTVKLLVFQTDEALDDTYVINTWGMNSSTLADQTQLLTEDSDGYLDYAVTASSDGLVTVVLSQGANSEWVVEGWPTTSYSPTTGPTPFPEPLSVSQASSVVQNMDQDILSTVSQVPPTTGPSSPTTQPSTEAQIVQAYTTLFDLSDPSVADKEAVIQNGASLATALEQAETSSLGQSATGAAVESVSMLEAPTCTQYDLPYPCAQVTYDISGTNGVVLLSGETGYAVEINGSWLVATSTVCDLLDDFYAVEGKTGTPPGCSAADLASTTTTSSSTSTTSPQSVGSTTSTSASFGSSGTTAATSLSSDSTRSGGEEANGVVTTSSGSLAFTGAGPALRVVATGGAGLVLSGLLLLLVADAPRHLLRRLALARQRQAPAVSPRSATRVVIERCRWLLGR